MDDISELAEIFKALSDPTRLRLVRLLSDQDPGEAPCGGGGQRFLCVNALAQEVGVSQSAVSQHLRVLRQAGLVYGTRKGSFMHYTLDPVGLEKYKTTLKETLGSSFSAD
jgi:DNA-binding transcriptional ArsR family regulator